MSVNANKPKQWKRDIAQSVDYYNNWFMRFAPKAYRETREQTAQQVLAAFKTTDNLRELSSDTLKSNPSILKVLRMATAPPIARDRLIGLAGVSGNLVKNMEQKDRLPPRMKETKVDKQLAAIGDVISRLLDYDILPWLTSEEDGREEVIFRAATVIADRLCGAVSDPIIRNAQEQRQLTLISQWLEARGYRKIESGSKVTVDAMPAGTYSLRMNVPVQQKGRDRTVNIPVDVVIKPKHVTSGDSAQALSPRRDVASDDFPLLVEAKSAGDFTNTNKRRKEEATKVNQLRYTYGDQIQFILFLCGYFDSGYLGYEAAEGIDWVWEHRIDDLAAFGL
jgi:hypothetical protein